MRLWSAWSASACSFASSSSAGEVGSPTAGLYRRTIQDCCTTWLTLVYQKLMKNLVVRLATAVSTASVTMQVKLAQHIPALLTALQQQHNAYALQNFILHQSCHCKVCGSAGVLNNKSHHKHPRKRCARVINNCNKYRECIKRRDWCVLRGASPDWLTAQFPTFSVEERITYLFGKPDRENPTHAACLSLLPLMEWLQLHNNTPGNVSQTFCEHTPQRQCLLC